MIPLLALVLVGWLVARFVRDLLDASRVHPDAPADLADDPDAAPDAPLAWLHRRLVEGFALERDGWAAVQARRVEARLQAGVPEDEWKRVLVLWMPEVTAFTFPGRHVYVSRRLMERAGSDDAVAFVVAHELAHHKLGHASGRLRWMDRWAGIPGGEGVAAIALAASVWMRGPDDELAADAHALRACMDAGYDPARCLDALNVMEGWMLDHGDLAGVFGPDGLIDAEVQGAAVWRIAAGRWAWERERGYPSLHERRERLRALAWPRRGDG